MFQYQPGSNLTVTSIEFPTDTHQCEVLALLQPFARQAHADPGFNFVAVLFVDPDDDSYYNPAMAAIYGYKQQQNSASLRRSLLSENMTVWPW